MLTLKNPAILNIDRNFDIPSVPIVLTKILRLVDDDQASSRRLEELILHDPALSARILKLANSAFYSFRNEVKTISHAISLLGLNLVKSLAIGVSIFESFTKGLREETGCINQLWMHSFGVGLIGQEIWTRRWRRAEGEFALLCGLLHDLGKVVYFKKDGPRYARLFTMQKAEEVPDLCTLENEHYGVDHTVLGSLIAKQWGLPPELGAVVRQHHSPLTNSPLTAAISMADMLAKQSGVGYDGDSRITADLESLRGLLQMPLSEFEALGAFAESKRSDVEEFFQFVS